MRLAKPRIAPLPVDEIPDEIREKLGDQPPLNIFRTLARHPKLMKRWLVFATHVLGPGSTLSARDRELAILRIGWLCRSGYEWGQHVVMARGAGLSDAEIERVAEGPDAEGWSGIERAILRATDELHADAFVGDATWQALAAHYSTEQCMDLVFTIGQYNMVSMVLNTLGVQPEEGLPRLPAKPPAR